MTIFLSLVYNALNLRVVRLDVRDKTEDNDDRHARSDANKTEI